MSNGTQGKWHIQGAFQLSPHLAPVCCSLDPLIFSTYDSVLSCVKSSCSNGGKYWSVHWTMSKTVTAVPANLHLRFKIVVQKLSWGNPWLNTDTVLLLFLSRLWLQHLHYGRRLDTLSLLNLVLQNIKGGCKSNPVLCYGLSIGFIKIKLKLMKNILLLLLILYFFGVGKVMYTMVGIKSWGTCGSSHFQHFTFQISTKKLEAIECLDQKIVFLAQQENNKEF